MYDDEVDDLLAALRRDLDLLPSPVPDRPGLLVRDPFRYSDVVLIIPPPIVPCLAFFNGRYGEGEVRKALMGLTEDERVGAFLGHLRETLSDAGFLEDGVSERLRDQRRREFAGAARRDAVHAGSAYPASAEPLRETRTGPAAEPGPTARPSSASRPRTSAPRADGSPTAPPTRPSAPPTPGGPS